MVRSNKSLQLRAGYPVSNYMLKVNNVNFQHVNADWVTSKRNPERKPYLAYPKLD